jgi:hypothetical protein
MFVGPEEDQVFDSEMLLWVNLEGVLPLLGCPDNISKMFSSVLQSPGIFHWS